MPIATKATPRSFAAPKVPVSVSALVTYARAVVTQPPVSEVAR